MTAGVWSQLKAGYLHVCGLCWMVAGLSARIASQNIYLGLGFLVAWWLGSRSEHLKQNQAEAMSTFMT